MYYNLYIFEHSQGNQNYTAFPIENLRQDVQAEKFMSFYCIDRHWILTKTTQKIVCRVSPASITFQIITVSVSVTRKGLTGIALIFSLIRGN